MDSDNSRSLHDQAKDWVCNHFSITDHDEDAVALLRKVADSIAKLGAVDILDITYCKHIGLPKTEMTVTVYFALSE
jgi:hypothetical protein